MQTKKCKKCRKTRKLTQFSLRKDAREIDDPIKERQDTCRFCNYDGLTADQRHLILREAYRHYLTYRYLLAIGEVEDVIEYSVPVSSDEPDKVVPITISFTDLERALKIMNDGLAKGDGTVLSTRKEQAFYLNVIRDMKQKDVAEQMGITTVSVGQYVDQAMLQLAEYYFGDTDTSNPEESGS